MKLRPPEAGDGARIWRLVREAGSLELNSAYAYVLMASDFADTCEVAEEDGELLGAVVGYRPPRRPDSLFVWQVAVAATARGRGLGRRLLRELVARTAPAGVRWVEATVTPGNAPSRALFESLARELGTECRIRPHFTPELFPGEHEAEELFRIGPFTLAQAAAPSAATLAGSAGQTTRETR